MRHADHEHDVRRFLEEQHLLPLAVFAEAPAVVAPDDDDRVVLQTEALQRFHHPAKLGIDKTRRRV